MNALIDIGANLTHDCYARDLDRVVARAVAAGVRRMLVTGTSPTASQAALELAQGRPGLLYATAGVHPHHASELTAGVELALAALLSEPAVVAAGECGLDFYRDFSPRPDQRQAFAVQLHLAADAGKPVFLHQRDAHAEFTAMLRDYLPGIPGGVAHCFTDGPAELEAYLELGLHIGITGWVCDERRGEALRDAVPRVPVDRLLLETDAPYLLPRDLGVKVHGRRNEPAFLPHILATVARLRSEDPGALAAATTRNAERLFGLGPEPESAMPSA